MNVVYMHVCVCMSHTSVHVAEVQEGHLVLLYSLGKCSPLEKELDCWAASPSDPLSCFHSSAVTGTGAALT